MATASAQRIDEFVACNGSYPPPDRPRLIPSRSLEMDRQKRLLHNILRVSLRDASDPASTLRHGSEAWRDRHQKASVSASVALDGGLHPTRPFTLSISNVHSLSPYEFTLAFVTYGLRLDPRGRGWFPGDSQVRYPRANASRWRRRCEAHSVPTHRSSPSPRRCGAERAKHSQTLIARRRVVQILSNETF